MMVDIRKLIAAVVVGGVASVLAIHYLFLVGTASARERVAACAALERADRRPANSAIKSFPTPARDFTAIDYRGDNKNLNDYRGKVVLLNFWASWCGTCKQEKPSLADLQREFADDGLEVVAIASDDEWEPIREQFRDGTPLRILLDPPGDDRLGPIARTYGVEKVPESFLIDRQGQVRHYFVNKRDWSSDVARTCVRSLLDE